MTSRQSSVAIAACLFLVAACTGTGAGTAEVTTVPPNVFAPTPSIDDGAGSPSTTRPAPTTTVDVERMSLYRVDPVTLQTLPDFDPIPMGDWFWGEASPTGNYFAANVGDDSSGPSEIRLVDVEAWEPVATWAVAANSTPVITDDGRVYFQGSSQPLQINSLQAGETRSRLVAEMPGDVYPWALRLSAGQIQMFGTRSLPAEGTANGAIILVEVSSGNRVDIDLPEVRIWASDAGDEPWSGYLYNFPAVVWDDPRNRALVVHAQDHFVSEVDFGTGAVTEHELTVEQPDDDPNGEMTAALSPDGSILYIGALRSTVTVADEDWSVTRSPTGVMAVDTTTWETVNRLDAPIGWLQASPDGDRLLAWGYTVVESESQHRMESAGLYVLDTPGLNVLAHYQPEQAEEWIGPVSFSQDGSLGYVPRWGEVPSVSVLDLETGQMLSSREGGTELVMIGSIAALGASELP
jgi:hypothetical protein